jgi:hypothetical protein
VKGGDLRVFSLQSGENDVATSAWTIVTIECVGGIAADTNIVVMTVTVGIGGRGRRRRWRWSCGYYSDARHGGRSLMLGDGSYGFFQYSCFPPFSPNKFCKDTILIV